VRFYPGEPKPLSLERTQPNETPAHVAAISRIHKSAELLVGESFPLDIRALV